YLTGWDRIYDEKNRPPVRFRWSTGPQSLLKMTYLSATNKAHWLTLEPTEAFAATWNSLHKSYPMLGIFLNRYTPCIRTHRIVVYDRLPKNHDLGNCIYQFGQHMLKCENDHKLSPFNYSPNQTYSGLEVGFQELGCWILSNNVKLWGAADTALMNYLLDRTEAHWSDYAAKKMKLWEILEVEDDDVEATDSSDDE
ncbi:hypothetical protein GGP41_006062, partial [Bipolaris sorokiniana]